MAMSMDSDSDNEDLVSFGTPLEIIEEDEPLPKPISVQDQVARDRQGRQRFHGAFTGGFSAGFFNTVGSKEGFTPSTFVSSRGRRADHHDHRPEDYMDEDDKGEYGIAPRKLVTTLRFAGEEVGFKKRPAPDSSVIPDDGRIQDIIKPTDETVGARLLRKMGWKPGQGVGPKMERKKRGKRKKKKAGRKVYGCTRPPIHEQQGDNDDDDDEEDEKEDDDSTSNEVSDDEDFMRGFLFAPDDIQDFMFAPKDDQHGIGYRGMDSTSVLGSHVTLFEEPVVKPNRRQGIKGHAFGIGAFEDEEENDIYSADRMSNYDRVLGGEEDTHEKRMYGWTGPPPSHHSSDGDVLDGFKAASQKKFSTKVFQPPNLPRDFRPFHHFRTSTLNTSDQSKAEPQPHSRFSLSADQRAAMLGEEQLPGPTSIDELLSSRDLALLKEARNKASTSQQSGPQHRSRWDRGAPHWSYPTQEAATQGGGSSFQPFAKDAEKQQRYEQYLENRHRGSEMAVGDSRTEWEKQQEQEEFSRAASLYHKPMSGFMASRFVRAKHTDDADDMVDIPAETGGDTDDQRKAADMKMFGQLTRDTMEWHPDKLLCKRFNVADPYPGSSIVGLPMVKKDKFSVFNFLEIQQPTSAQMDIYPTQPGLAKVASKEMEEQGPSFISSSSLKRSRWDQHPGILANVGSKQEVKGDESQETSKVAEYGGPSQDSTTDNDDKARPPLDLFQAIFLDSDSSNSSSSDEEERDEDNDRKKSDNVLQSELQATQGLESSKGGENPEKNDGVEVSKENKRAFVVMTRLEDFDDNEEKKKIGSDSLGILKVEGKEIDGYEEDSAVEEEEEEEQEEEEYGPMLPPSLDYTQDSKKQYTGSQHEGTTEKKSRRDSEKKKEKREKKSKKRKNERKSRGRSRTGRKDTEKHARESTSRHKQHEKIKKSKHRHGSRHKHSHRKSSKGREKRHGSSTDYNSSPSSDNEI